MYALVGEPLTYPEGGAGLEFAKVLWIGDPSAVGHAIITGHQVDGTHAVGFGTGTPQPELMWDLPNTRAWKSEPSEVQIAATGCYSFEVAIGKTHESIVLEVTATPPPSPTASSHWVQRLLMTDSFVGPIALSPTAVYALSNSLSLSGPEVGFMTLTRLERSTLVETRVDLRGNSGSERGSELLYAGGHLWLTGINVGSDGNPGSERWLDELDPQSLAPVRRLALPSGTSGTLQFATAGEAATIWVGDENRLFWIDAASGSIRTTQQLPGAVGSLSVDPLGQRLYVGLHLSQPLVGDKNEVLELDSARGTRLASLAVGVWELGSPGVAASNAGVWIWYATGNLATAGFYSAVGLQFKEGTASGHSNGVQVVVSGGTVWLSDSGILVACISPSSGQPIASTIASFTSIASDSSGAYAGGQGLAVLVPPRACTAGS